MPHHPPPPPHDPRPPEWLINDEKQRPLADVAQRLQKIGALLQERGAVRLGDIEVRPMDTVFFVTRYERMPRGELKLKLELTWGEGMRGPQQEAELPIE